MPAQGALRISFDSHLNALSVEVMHSAAGQRSHFVILAELSEADWALFHFFEFVYVKFLVQQCSHDAIKHFLLVPAALSIATLSFQKGFHRNPNTRSAAKPDKNSNRKHESESCSVGQDKHKIDKVQHVPALSTCVTPVCPHHLHQEEP